jgi:REP element-mobilizing transposase RayT
LSFPARRIPVTQRGNRRERIFFNDEDYALYRDWLAESCAKFGVEVWAYCLMPNHVHLILTPADPAGLGLAMSRAQRLGRPLGSESFTKRAEALLGRTLAPAKRGPKPKMQPSLPQRG